MSRFVAVLALIAASSGLVPAHAADADADADTIVYRDEYGVPHVFAATLEDAAFAVGYAQAEDRLEELLKNYRRAAGTMAEVFGPDYFREDLAQRIWRHEAISRERFDQVSPKLRAVMEAYQRGIKQFMHEHPEQVPAWAQQIHPWDVVALSRYIIWGWPMGEAVAELQRAGIPLDPPAYRGSNEVLIAPSRTAMRAPIAIIDPHLGWYGQFRFYQVRIYAGDFAVSGVSILGAPLPSLGHSRYCSVAMTTGGPDTSDVYEEELNPDNPRQYRYDGRWRDMQVRKERIGVKQGDKVTWREVEIEATHHGPIVAHKNGKAYAVAIPYANEVGLSDQVYATMTAHNLGEMKRALGQLQLMAQNVMVGTVQGDIYYLRNGRVPVRAPGVDPSRPVAGNTSATEWQGIHPLSDLVQITNPSGGWMQNCNVSPFAMMKEHAPKPEAFEKHPYLYNAPAAPPHQRAAMMNDLLEAANRVTVEQAIDIAFNPQVWHAELWQARIKQAWQTEAAPAVGDPRPRTPEQRQVYDLIQAWNRRSDADSPGALAFYAFKLSLPPEMGRHVEPPLEGDFSDVGVLIGLEKAAAWLKTNFNSVETPYGRYFRVGREGGSRSWPVGGGTLRDQGMATPRAISFTPAAGGKQMVGRGGQTSTQIVILTNPPQSYTVIPLGESDHPESGHWDDQAEKLFSKSKAAPTYFLNRAELMKHVTSQKVLHPGSNLAAGASAR